MTDMTPMGRMARLIARRIAPLFVHDGTGPVRLTCPVDGHTLYEIRQSEDGGFDIGIDGRFFERVYELTAWSTLEDAKGHVALLIARTIEDARDMVRKAEACGFSLDPAHALEPLFRIKEAWQQGRLDTKPGVIASPLRIVLVADASGTPLLNMDQCDLAQAARVCGKGHRTALKPMVAIARAIEDGQLDVGKDGVLYADTTGTPLLTLEQVLTARDVLAQMNRGSALD